MAIRNTRVRKRLFVDSKVQGALLRRLLANWAAALSLGILGIMLMQLAQHGISEPVGFYLNEVWNEYYLVFVLMILSLPAIAFDSIKLSHRFTGPQYAVRMALKKLAKGESIHRITFRKHDFWYEVADDINKVAEQLGQLQETPLGESDSSADLFFDVSDESTVGETQATS